MGCCRHDGEIVKKRKCIDGKVLTVTLLRSLRALAGAQKDGLHAPPLDDGAQPVLEVAVDGVDAQTVARVHHDQEVPDLREVVGPVEHEHVHAVQALQASHVVSYAGREPLCLPSMTAHVQQC